MIYFDWFCITAGRQGYCTIYSSFNYTQKLNSQYFIVNINIYLSAQRKTAKIQVICDFLRLKHPTTIFHLSTAYTNVGFIHIIYMARSTYLFVPFYRDLLLLT